MKRFGLVSFHVVIATSTKGNPKPKLVWRGVGSCFKDYQTFLDAISINKLDDRADYAH